MKNLFAYGTLRCEDIMEAVSGYRLSSEAATLQGFSRHPVKGQKYPAIMPCEDGQVDGVVYRNIPVRAWMQLDQFEGEMYLRRDMQIELDSGLILSAAVYVVRMPYRALLEDSDWSFSNFLRSDKNLYQRRLLSGGENK